MTGRECRKDEGREDGRELFKKTMEKKAKNVTKWRAQWDECTVHKILQCGKVCMNYPNDNEASAVYY